jgi:hypothetical protein
MKRQMSWALLGGGIALAASTATAVPAAAATSGTETFTGTIVTSGWRAPARQLPRQQGHGGGAWGSRSRRQLLDHAADAA